MKTYSIVNQKGGCGNIWLVNEKAVLLQPIYTERAQKVAAKAVRLPAKLIKFYIKNVRNCRDQRTAVQG